MSDMVLKVAHYDDSICGQSLYLTGSILGTFEAETEEVVFGLTHPLDTFDQFEVQVRQHSTQHSLYVLHPIYHIQRIMIRHNIHCTSCIQYIIYKGS